MSLFNEEPGTMRNSIKVIVERRLNFWAAWFDGYPQIQRRGECHDEAFQQLLKLFGEELFDLEKAAVVTETIQDGHLEVMVPIRCQQGIPSPSTN